MYNNDYIIAVDENGQPFIAHANGEGTWFNRAVQYIKKIPKPGGGFRYIYDRAKSGAKKAWGSKAGRWIDEHDAGITEKLMEKRALRLAKKHSKKGGSGAGKYYAHRAMQLHQESAKERAAAKEKIDAKKKAAYDKTVGRAKDWLGYDEREARDKAHQALLNGSYNERTKAGKMHRFKETQEAYANTPLGRLDEMRARYNVWNYNRKRGRKK